MELFHILNKSALHLAVGIDDILIVKLLLENKSFDISPIDYSRS